MKYSEQDEDSASKVHYIMVELVHLDLNSRLDMDAYIFLNLF